LRPFDLPAVGPVDARFGKVAVYGAPDHKIAVGVDMDVLPVGAKRAPTRGRVWLTARPVNKPGSAEVRFTDLHVKGDTNGIKGDIFVLLAQQPDFAPMITDALTQNFTRDLTELEAKIRGAIDQRREGAFVIRTRIDSFETGEIKAYGNGLYLPVRMVGAASIDYRPAK
jgi:hypothetical protein